MCERPPHAKVHDYMERNHNQLLWGPIFRRNLLESKERSLLALLDALGLRFLNGDPDCRMLLARFVS